MRLFLGSVAGLFGGYLVGMAISAGAHIGLGAVLEDSSAVLVGVGLLPYLTALVGVVLVPVVLARRGSR